MYISNTLSRYIELAINMANQSDYKTFRHGAVLVKSGRILNCSYNKKDYNSLAAKFKLEPKFASLHAEIGTILGMSKQITNNGTIVVVRIDKNNKLKLSKPCNMCARCLKFVGIKKVFFSIDDDNFGEILL